MFLLHQGKFCCRYWAPLPFTGKFSEPFTPCYYVCQISEPPPLGRATSYTPFTSLHVSLHFALGFIYTESATAGTSHDILRLAGISMSDVLKSMVAQLNASQLITQHEMVTHT